jgi:hypothetical protein
MSYYPGPGMLFKPLAVSPSSYFPPMKYLGPVAMKVGISYDPGAGFSKISLF